MYYLPVISKNWACQPDLIIASTNVQPTIAVTITNTGNCSTGNGFWVDFEVEPNPPPTKVNDVCDFPHVSCIGAIVWGVTKNLEPGESLMLLLGDEYYQPSLSAPWPAGTYQVCFFVDSTNSLNPVYGGVIEGNENNNIICLDESMGPGPARIKTAGEVAPGNLSTRLR